MLQNRGNLVFVWYADNNNDEWVVSLFVIQLKEFRTPIYHRYRFVDGNDYWIMPRQRM